MRRRAFPAIVGAIVMLLAIAMFLLVFYMDRVVTVVSTPGFGSPIQPPVPPTFGVADYEPQSGEPTAPLNVSEIQDAWAAVEKTAQETGWVPWVRVVEASSGEVILAANNDAPHTPASTMKVLTGYFALSQLDADQTLSTGTSIEGSDLYLWGEGDLLLGPGESNPNVINGRAGLATLAKETAQALKNRDRTAVNLRYQDRLFEGDLRPAAWYDQEVTDFGGDQVAFAIDTGRTYPGAWDFVDSSARDAAEQFAAALKEEGISVETIEPGSTAKDADELATVESATVLDQVQYMVLTSDNTLAEQYCRLATRTYSSDGSATLDDSTAALTTFLSESGVDTSSMTARDCSGLDSDTRISPVTLTDAVSLSAQDTGAASSLVRFLPVGGMTGTLAGRFDDSPGLGNVAAKTGSLGSVSSLAGVVSTDSGHLLVFAVGADEVPGSAAHYYQADLDRFVTALARS